MSRKVFSKMACSRCPVYILIIPLLAGLLLIGASLQGYGWKLGRIYPTVKLFNHHEHDIPPFAINHEVETIKERQEHDIPPWAVTYEGETIKERQAHRHRILKNVCKTLKRTRMEKVPSDILVNSAYKIVYCYIPKVGSTYTLKALIETNRLRLGMPKEELIEHNVSALLRYGIRQLKTYPKEEQKVILRTHYKFLFVRHPFTRLRSAHGMFTEEVNKAPEEASEPLLKITEGLLNGTDWRVKGFPNFKKFIHIISSKWKKIKQARNHHWDNFQDICSPCDIKYDFIGKHEHFAEEMNYVFKNHIPKAEPIKAELYQTHWIGLDQIYQNLSKKTLDLFLQRYTKDFQLFNYRYKL